MKNIDKLRNSGLIIFCGNLIIFILIILNSIPTPINETISEIKTDLLTNREKYMFIIDKIKNIKTKSERYYLGYHGNMRKYEFRAIDSTSHEDFIFPKELWIPIKDRNIKGITVEVNDNISFYILDGYAKESIFLCYYYNNFIFEESRFAQDSILYYSGEKMPKVKIRWLYQIDKNWIILSR